MLNRNAILVYAVLLGLALGQWAVPLKDWTLYILAFVMMVSTSGIDHQVLMRPRGMVKPMLLGVFYNYVLHSSILLLLGWWLMPDRALWYGFVVIAASPPGVGIIPFTYILRGDLKYSTLAVLGGFLASVALAPLIVRLFAGGATLDPVRIIWVMVQIIVLPLLLSRLLFIPAIKPAVDKYRGQVVNWGFALIIFVAVGINREVFFSKPLILFYSALALFIAIFVAGIAAWCLFPRLGLSPQRSVSNTLLLIMKSSGFTAATALALFGERAAIPSAVLAVMVLMFLLYLMIIDKISKKKA